MNGSRALGWPRRMAIRDLRASLGSLFIVLASLTIGLAGMTASYALHRALFDTLDERARALLAADVVFSAKKDLSPVIESVPREAGHQLSNELRFRTMAYAPEARQSTLVQLRAVDSKFPLYGAIETEPPGAWRELTLTDKPSVVLDESLLHRLGLEVGKEVQLAGETVTVLGVVRTSLGEVNPASAFTPRVFLPERFLKREEVERKGSVVDHLTYVRSPNERALDALLDTLRPTLEKEQVKVETTQDRRRLIGKVSDNAVSFLLLGSLAAFLLGSLAAGSSMSSYLRRKIPSVVTLRCLGAPSSQIAWFVMFELLVIGAGAALLGGLLGTLLYYLVTVLVPTVARVAIPFSLPLPALGLAAAVGTLTLLVISLAPLQLIRSAPPLAAFRPDYDPAIRNRSVIVSAVLQTVLVAGVTFLLFGDAMRAGVITGSLVCVLLVLLILGVAARRLVRRIALPRLPFAARYGVLNIGRPGRQVLPLFTALSFGVFLIATTFTVCRTLSAQAGSAQGAHKPSLFFFDIQPDQEADVRALIERNGLPVLQTAPIVMMRLSTIKGRPVQELLKEPGSTIPPWILRRDFWTTYRAEMTKNERLVEGTWVPSVAPGTEVAPVSFDKRVGEDLGLHIGDEVTFDVQGVDLRAKVTSFREILWEQLERNSIIVFPNGVLEDAPHFGFMSTRTGGPEQTARLQNESATQFPNVSVVDLTAILTAVTEILEEIKHALLLVAFAIGLTAFVVLLGTVLSSRRERVREGVLLRTLGASSSQVRTAVASEYLVISTLASLAGTIAALLAAWSLAHFLFKAPLAIPAGTLMISALAVIAVTTIVAAFVGREVTRHSPAEVLRDERG